jgi:Short C-terminal domain
VNRQDRARAEQEMLVLLDQAEREQDPVAEEVLIWRGIEIANRDFFGRLARTFNASLGDRTARGRVRRGEDIGFVGHILVWSDRVVVKNDHGGATIYPVDEHLRATMETAGSITVTKHPTLTRMAAGALLPGSALIPGFAFQKKQTHDSRELYFVIEHPEWAAMAQVNPNFAAAVREVTMKLNQAAAKRSLERQRERDASETRSSRADALEQLARLGQLRDAGVLTSAEFESQKAKILSDM